MSTTGLSTNLSEIDGRSNNTSSIYFNQTNEHANVAVSGLTYTLFGLSCFLTCLGLIGNVTILTITWKFRKPGKGHDVLIISLAIIDSIALSSTALMQPCVYEVLRMDVRAITSIGCKGFMSVWLSAKGSSSIVVVLISIERFLAVWFPLKIRSLLSSQTALRSLWLCMTPIVIICVTMSTLYCEIDKYGICIPNVEGSVYSSVLQRMPDTTIFKVMGIIMQSPLLILLILTPMTVVKLFKQKAIRRHLTSQELNNGTYQISVKLTAVAITHCTLYVIPLATAIAYGFNDTVPDINVVSWITLPLLLHHSLNFLLYNIFDTEFRSRVSNLFGLKGNNTRCNRNIEIIAMSAPAKG